MKKGAGGPKTARPQGSGCNSEADQKETVASTPKVRGWLKFA